MPTMPTMPIRPSRARWAGARRVVATILALLGAALSHGAESGPAALEPDAVRIGVQPDAFPFSHNVGTTAEPRYRGYAVDLCLEIVRGWRQRQGRAADVERDIQWVEVRPRNRLMKLLAGEIDLECSSTSNTEARRSLGIVFSPTYFISSVGLLVHPALKPHAESLMGLLGQARAKDLPLVTTAGSTSVRHLQDLIDDMATPNGRKLRVVYGASHDDSIRKLLASPQPAAYAFMMDQALLVAAMARNPEYQKAGLFVVPWSPVPHAQECYGLMTRRTNPPHLRVGGQDFSQVVHEIVLALRQPGDSDDASTPMHTIYRRWFQSPLEPDQLAPGSPAGVNLGMPPSPQLSQALVSMTARAGCL